MVDEIEPVFGLVNVSCITEGCENQGISIQVTVNTISPSVVCGPCMADITNSIVAIEVQD